MSSIPQNRRQLEWIDMIPMELGDSSEYLSSLDRASGVSSGGGGCFGIATVDNNRPTVRSSHQDQFSPNNRQPKFDYPPIQSTVPIRRLPIQEHQQQTSILSTQDNICNNNNNNDNINFDSDLNSGNNREQNYFTGRKSLRRSSIASSSVNKIDGCQKRRVRRVTIMKPTREDKTNRYRTCLAVLCILQACLILGILGLSYYFEWPLIINLSRDKSSSATFYDRSTNTIRSLTNDDNINIYRVYSNGQNTTKILVDLARGCNQREHDWPQGEACESSKLSFCKRVETLASHQPSDEFSSSSVASDQQSFSTTRRKLTLITSSKIGGRHEVRMMPIRWVNNCPAQDQPNCHFKTRLSTYLNEPLQSIIGWGGALTDSSINNILSLSINGTRSLLDDYFSRERGLGYNLVRITIGGSDLSGRFYTNDDLKPGLEDFGMENFRLREEDTLYKIPLLRMIQTDYQQQVKLFGSVWSPPVWMKTNNHFNKGQLRGAIGLKDQPNADRYFRALAEYKARFIDAYQRESIKFWALTVMNEPYFAKQPFLDFNTMIFPTNDYATYVATILGPRLRNDERLRDIKLLVHDDNRKFLRSDTEQVVNRSDVQKYIHGIATHGYVDEDFGAMTEIWEKYKGKFFLLPDELCSGHLPFMDKALVGSWERGLHYAIDIIQGLRHRASGWVDWNMALDTEGGPGWLGGRLDSAIIVDAARDTYYKSPMFYVIGHFSRYVPEGSVKISEKIINDKYDFRLLTATFLTPGKKQLVLVVLNENPYNIELIVEPLKSSGHIAPRQNAGFQVVVEPESITTILYPLPAEYTNPSMDTTS